MIHFLSNPAFWEAIATIALVIVGMRQANISNRQAQISEKQADISMKSLEESQKANTAAKEASVETRRYMEFIESADVQITLLCWGASGILPPDFLECHFKNFGKTAATGIDLRFRFEPRTVSHYCQLPQFNLGADQIDRLQVNLRQAFSEDEIEGMRAERVDLKFDIGGSYRDVFRRNKQLTFIGHWNTAEHRFIVTRFDSA